MNQQYNFSSVQGKIKYLLMAFDSTRVEKPMGRMLALLQSMPGVKFLLWCSRPDIQEMVCQYLESKGVSYSAHLYDAAAIEEEKDCIVVYESFSSVNPWIRDAFFTANLMGNQCLLLDTVDEDASDQGWAKRLEKMNLASGVKFKIFGNSDENAENLAIAGGDVLMDGKWVFLGKKSPMAELLIAEHFNPSVEIIVLEEKAAYPALYHIDLFLTLTGIRDNGRYVVMVGKCVALQPEFENEAKRNNECLDSIARRLEQDYQLKVIRNPLPINDYLYSYNNCIVELTHDQKNVWLPAYSFDAPHDETLRSLEEEIKTIWRDQGFNPCLVPASYSDLLGVKAGLHCITNEVRGES